MKCQTKCIAIPQTISKRDSRILEQVNLPDNGNDTLSAGREVEIITDIDIAEITTFSTFICRSIVAANRYLNI